MSDCYHVWSLRRCSGFCSQCQRGRALIEIEEQLKKVDPERSVDENI